MSPARLSLEHSLEKENRGKKCPNNVNVVCNFDALRDDFGIEKRTRQSGRPRCALHSPGPTTTRIGERASARFDPCTFVAVYLVCLNHCNSIVLIECNKSSDIQSFKKVFPQLSESVKLFAINGQLKCRNDFFLNCE